MLTGPQDYDRFCITAPVDRLLPGGGGYQLCDIADVTPSKFGLVDYVATLASHFGVRKEVFNGVDASFNARFGQGVLLQGGVSWGRTATECVGRVGTLPVADVDAPVQFCKNTPPFRPEFKLSGVYPLPVWGLQGSATFQQLPGAPFGSVSSGEGETNVTYPLTSAEAKRYLGRDLAQGPRGVAIATLVQPNTYFEDRITQLDVRLTKILQVGRARVQGMFDIYNILNEDAILSQQVRYGSASPIFRQPRGVLGARLFKLGAQLNF